MPGEQQRQWATKEDIDNFGVDLRDHVKEDKEFQKTLFNYLERKFLKVDQLWDEMNKRVGADSKTGKILSFSSWTVQTLISFVAAVAAVKIIK